MSNLRSSGHMPLKTPMTNKWKSQAPTSELLERQTRALEDSLNKLKLAMHPDKNKPPSAENTGPIWDRGKTGPLTQYANHILRDDSRRVFDANKPTKVRVLGDEPPATVNRPSLVANLFSNKPTSANKLTSCGQCEKEEAKVKCLECAECYCTTCYAHFHLRGALQRHRCVPLNESRPATPQKKRPPVGADVIFKELRFAQSKDDLFRKSTMASGTFTYGDNEDIDYEEDEGGELLRGNYDEKTSAASFQQALQQWRQGGEKKKPTKTKRSTHEAAVDTVHDSNGLLHPIVIPNIEFHSSNLTYGEKLLLKKYRRANKNHQEFFNQRTPLPSNNNRILTEPANKKTEILVDRSLTQTFPSKSLNVNIEPLYDELPTTRTEDSARTITAETNQNNNHFDHDDDDDEEEELMRLKQQERTKSRTSMKGTSRPSSAAKRKNSISSRPSSVAMFQHPLPSLLATTASEELKAMADPQSRPSSAALKKPTKLDYRLPTIWNRNWKPEQSVADGLDPKSVQIDQHSITQFDSALQDLLDENKIESANRSDNPIEISRPPTAEIRRIEREKPIQSPTPTPTPRRNSPFNFNNTSRKVESSSSVDTGDGGFFTDVSRKKHLTSPVPAPIIEPAPSARSIRASNEQRSAIPNLVSLRKASIESFSRPPPKRSIHLEEAHTQLDDQSRPGSSLSSSSLPVSIISSKPDFITRPSIERRPKILTQPTTNTATTTAKKFRVEFSKRSSPPPPPPGPVMPSMVIEGKKVTSARNSARDSGDDRLQQSMHFTRNKTSSGVQKSHSTLKASSTSTMTSITRDENILRDESLTITDATAQRGSHRRSTNIEREPTKSRKMEFTVKDGMKWQNSSAESVPTKSVVRRSSKTNTPRPGTPSNPNNSKLAHQFSAYDNDDGRSSRACQDVDDEECFHQLHEELCSELEMTSPGWDASLSEHVLKNLRGTEVQFNEKDLQDNLAMLETKLRENETIRRSQTDDDLSVHEEIRNL